MIYSENEILQYIDENDVKFVKLTFCDMKGRLKNISVLSSELAVTFERGVRITAKKIAGFEAANGKDLFLFPDAQTISSHAAEQVLPRAHRRADLFFIGEDHSSREP